jgi:hypothetical protein
VGYLSEGIMKRLVRRVAWVGVAVTLVALALGTTTRILGPSPGVTEANVRRIQPGMTMKEVEAILGTPPQERFSFDGMCFSNDDGSVQLRKPAGGWGRWIGPDGDARLEFQEGRVLTAGFSPATTVPTPLSRFRAWFSR